MSIDTDFISEIETYREYSSLLVTLLIDCSKNLGQYHIKLNYRYSNDYDSKKTFKTYNTLFGETTEIKVYGGIVPEFTPHVNTHNNGIYAFSLYRTHTVYVGANEYDNIRNNVYDRVIRFGRAIYNCEYESETHSAGTKFRTLYGEDTSDLYLSFLFYNQFTREIKNLMNIMKLQYQDIEKLLIRQFNSKYLLNSKI